MTRLYIDDERMPKTEGPWVIVRSFSEAVSYITDNGIPEFISFDHDLGLEESGYDFAKWLVDKDLDQIFLFPPGFDFFVHSANPVGSKNIQCYLDNYLRSKHRE